MSEEKVKNLLTAGVFVLLIVAIIFVLRMPAEPVDEPIARSSSNYGWLKVEDIVLSGTGTEGAVSDSEPTSAFVRGHLYAVHLDFNTSITNTTDFTLTQASPALTVLQLTNYYTDTWYYPAAQQTGSDGAGVGTYDQLLVNDQLTAEVGETISSTNIMTVTVYWGE